MKGLQNFLGFSDLFFFVLTFVLIGFLGFYFAKAIVEPLYDSKKSLDTYIKNTLHELNVPIATIEANIKLLEKNLTEEKDTKRLSRIKGASKNLQELYAELEYLLKKESGKIQIDEFEIKEFLEDIVHKFDDIKKGIILEFTSESKIIKCDKIGFAKVVENLISNAIKFNKNDGFVRVAFINDTLCVEDSGKGIENKNLFSIFERYYKEDNASFGHGIGLSIVKEYCDQNKIEIKITSKKDVGTKICLHLNPLTIN